MFPPPTRAQANAICKYCNIFLPFSPAEVPIHIQILSHSQ